MRQDLITRIRQANHYARLCTIPDELIFWIDVGLRFARLQSFLHFKQLEICNEKRTENIFWLVHLALLIARTSIMQLVSAKRYDVNF